MKEPRVKIEGKKEKPKDPADLGIVGEDTVSQESLERELARVQDERANLIEKGIDAQIIDMQTENLENQLAKYEEKPGSAA